MSDEPEEFEFAVTIEQRYPVFSDEFKHDHLKQTQWTAFLRKHNLQVEPAFSTVVTTIERFLEPLLDGSFQDKHYFRAENMWNRPSNTKD